MMTYFIAAGAFAIAGAFVGSILSLAWQAPIFAALIGFMFTRTFNSLDLYAMVVGLMIIGFLTGMALADVSYFVQNHLLGGNK